MKKMHLANAAGRDATIAYESLKAPPTPELSLPERSVRFVRVVAGTSGSHHEALVESHGEAYGQALVDGDPDADMEWVGREVGPTDSIYLTSEGKVLHASPRRVEVIYGPDGEEKERRPPVDKPGNVNDEVPVRWTGHKVPIAEAVRRFAFMRSVQLRHVDGLTFDFLYDMARELHEEQVMVRLGGGSRGKAPLMFRLNGAPYQAFLEGRVDGERYQLVLRLTNLELKQPEEAS